MAMHSIITGGLMFVGVTIMFNMIEEFFPPFSLDSVPLLCK